MHAMRCPRHVQSRQPSGSLSGSLLRRSPAWSSVQEAGRSGSEGDAPEPPRSQAARPPGCAAGAAGHRLGKPPCEALAGRTEAAAGAPLPAATPAVPPLAAAAHAATDAGAEEGEVGTGQPMEELMALEALAAQAASQGELPTSDDELDFGGFDD